MEGVKIMDVVSSFSAFEPAVSYLDFLLRIPENSKQLGIHLKP